MKIPSVNQIPASAHALHKPQAPIDSGASLTKSTASQFDKITISSDHSSDNLFQLQLKSRLSHEVRTATTTGTLSALRDQIAANEYPIDPVAIAKRMLLLEEI